MQETIGIKASVFVVLFLLISGASCAQGSGMKESYIESNWGFAFIGDFTISGSSRPDVFPFPGTSILVGQRKYFSDHGFIDAQIGLAFPSIATAKIGAGHTGQNGGYFSAGLRLFPTHAYIQSGFPSKRCNRDVSAKKQRRLERRGKSTADIKCSEWAFSLELSPIFFGDLLPINEEVRSLSLYSAAMLTAGHRWIF